MTRSKPYRNAVDRLSARSKADDGADDDRKDQPPPGDKEIRDGHHDQRRCGQVGTEAGKHLLERRDHEDHDDPDDDDRHDDHRDRIEQGRLDLGLDREHLLLVRGQPIENRVERARGLAGGDQVAIQGVEVARMLAERLRHRGSCLDLVLDLHHQAREARIAVAACDDLERLQQAARRPSASSRAAA